MIFKGVREGKPYPEHGLSYRDWSQIPPQQIRLDELVTTTTVLALDRLLSEDSTFYGDLFPHAVKWRGTTYLEDGLHRAVVRPCATAPCYTRECSTWTRHQAGGVAEQRAEAGPPISSLRPAATPSPMRVTASSRLDSRT